MIIGEDELEINGADTSVDPIHLIVDSQHQNGRNCHFV